MATLGTPCRLCREFKPPLAAREVKQPHEENPNSRAR